MATKAKAKKAKKAQKPRTSAKANKGEGKIAEILALYKEGKSYKEIEKKGYNMSTIRIQCAKWKREHGQPAAQKQRIAKEKKAAKVAA